MVHIVEEKHTIYCDEERCEEEISSKFNKERNPTMEEMKWIEHIKKRGWNVSEHRHVCPKCDIINSIEDQIEERLPEVVEKEIDEELAEKLNKKITELTEQQLNNGMAKVEVNISLRLEIVMSIKPTTSENWETYSDLFEIVVEEVNILEPGACGAVKEPHDKLAVQLELKAPWGYQVGPNTTREHVINEMGIQAKFNSGWWDVWSTRIENIAEEVLEKDISLEEDSKGE